MQAAEVAGWAVASLSGATTAAAIIQGAAFAHTMWTGHQASAKQQDAEYRQWAEDRKHLLADLQTKLEPDHDVYSRHVVKIMALSITAMAASPLYSLWPKVSTPFCSFLLFLFLFGGGRGALTRQRALP